MGGSDVTLFAVGARVSSGTLTRVCVYLVLARGAVLTQVNGALVFIW